MLSIATASAIAPTLKPFQYAAHHRPNHNYSPFHQNLEVALKCFYSKANLATVLLKKDLLSYENLYLLDYATLDVWPSVVFIKLPKWLPCKDSGLFEKAPQYFCRFISKKDFLEGVFEYAMLQGHQLDVICDRSQQFTVNSAKTGEPHTLTPSMPTRLHASRNSQDAESASKCPLPWRPGNKYPWASGGWYTSNRRRKSSNTGMVRVANLPLVAPLRMISSGRTRPLPS